MLMFPFQDYFEFCKTLGLFVCAEKTQNNQKLNKRNQAFPLPSLFLLSHVVQVHVL